MEELRSSRATLKKFTPEPRENEGPGEKLVCRRIRGNDISLMAQSYKLPFATANVTINLSKGPSEC